MEIFVGFRGNDASEKSSRNGFGKQDSPQGIPAGNHGPVERGNHDSSKHGPGENQEVIFPFLSRVGKRVRELVFPQDFPIEKPGDEERRKVSGHIIQDLYAPIIFVKRHGKAELRDTSETIPSK
jgi:hypothetical protein